MIKVLKKYFFESIIVLVLIFMYKESAPGWFGEWTNFDSFYGLGLFVLGFNVYYIKTNFSELKEIPKKCFPAGGIIILAATLLYIVGIRANLEYFVSFSLPFLIAGIILTLYGYKMFVKLLMPICLLTLILPIFPLHRLTMPLQLISTTLSATVLKALGLNTFADGTILYINHFKLAVVAGCSGLKSLFSMFFVCIIASYLEKVKLPKILLYLFMAIPLAVFMNVLRIVVTGIYGLYNGHEGLETFHDYAGLFTNIISIIFLIFVIRSNENKEESL